MVGAYTTNTVPYIFFYCCTVHVAILAVYSNARTYTHFKTSTHVNPLNAELNPICHLLALLAHIIFHVSRVRVNIQNT